MADWYLKEVFIAGSSMSHLENVVPYSNVEYQAMVDVIEPSPPSFPLPLSTPPPPSSFSHSLPPQFTQAGRPKRNYRLPARYEDVNPEPLWPLEEEATEQPTAVLPRLRLIVRNRLRTATNSFGLL
jgi:hypothetical protein